MFRSQTQSINSQHKTVWLRNGCLRASQISCLRKRRNSSGVAVHRCSTVALLRSSARARTPLDDHWCFRLRSLACVHFAQPDPLLSSWMSSSPAYTLQDFPVLADLASEHTAGPSLTQTPGNRNGGSVPANHAPTAASKYSNTDRPCCVQVAITVQIRSHQRFPFSLLVPCVIRRSITTNRIACSARLLVGSTPGVVMNRK